VGSTTNWSSGAGGVGKDENWDTKRKRKVHKKCQKIGVRGIPDEGGQEEGGDLPAYPFLS